MDQVSVAESQVFVFHRLPLRIRKLEKRFLPPAYFDPKRGSNRVQIRLRLGKSRVLQIPRETTSDGLISELHLLAWTLIRCIIGG